MDGSVFGSAIKTYPGKNNRTSRYYRPSSYQLQRTNVFDDDDEPEDLFDKLVYEERTKQTFSELSSNKTNASHFGSFTSRKSSFRPANQLSALQNIQNLDVKKSCRLLTTFDKNKNRNVGIEDKENRYRCTKLVPSDDDSSPDSMYIFDPDDTYRTKKKSKKKTDRKISKAQTVNLKKEKLKRLQYYRFQKFGERRSSRMKSLQAASTPILTSKNDKLVCDFSAIKKVEYVPRVLDMSKTGVDDVTNYCSKRIVADQSSDVFLFEPLSKLMPNLPRNMPSFLCAHGEFRKSTFNDSSDLSCCEKHKNYNSEQQIDVTCLRADEAPNPMRFSVAIAQLDGRQSCQFNPEIMSTPERNVQGNIPTLGKLNDAANSFGTNESEKEIEKNKVPNETLSESTRTSKTINEKKSNKSSQTRFEDSGEYDLFMDESFQTEIVRSPDKLNVDSVDVGQEDFVQDSIRQIENQNSFRLAVSTDQVDLNNSTTQPCVSNPKEDDNSFHEYAASLASSMQDLTLNSVDSKPHSDVSFSESPSRTSMKTRLTVGLSESDDEIEHLQDGITNILHLSEELKNEIPKVPDKTTPIPNTSFSSLYANCSSDSSEFLGFTPGCIYQAEQKKQQFISCSHPVAECREQDSESGTNISEQVQTVLECPSPASELYSQDNTEVYDISLDLSSDSVCNTNEFNVPDKLSTTGKRATIILNHPSTDSSAVAEEWPSESQYIKNADLENTPSISDSALSNTVILKKLNDSKELTPGRLPFGHGRRNSHLLCDSHFSPLQQIVKLDDISPIQNVKNSRPVVRLEEISPIQNLKDCKQSIRLQDVSPIRSGKDFGAFREEKRIDSLLACKPFTLSRLSRFEPLLEENAEETDGENLLRMESTRANEITFVNPNFVTMRRRKRLALPTVNELDGENDNGTWDGGAVLGSQSCSFMSRPSMNTFNKSTFQQSFVLKKGKKWRRSFITLKNIRGYGLNSELLDEDNKGRLWRKNLEELINDQSDAKIIGQELEECSTLKTGFDGTAVAGFEEGDTVSAKCGRPEKARFSLCMNVNVVNGSSSSDSNENSSRNENVDLSCASFLSELRETFVGNQHENQAGDYSRVLGFPLVDESVAESAKDVVLLYCKQSEPLPFETCFPDSVLQKCEKIGEGVYGEVFKLKNRSRCSVLKIIPIEGDQVVNGERQKKFDEILSELVISVQLSNLRKRKDYYTECFAEVLHCWCVYGRYPKRLLDLWKKYDIEEGSDNDSPKMFKDDQLYLILELNDGGKDVESFKFRNPQEALSVFNQVSNALAVAESAFHFEHRDLHWGNILVTRVTPKDSKTSFIIRDERKTCTLEGVKATIIDYTLSRISIGSRTLYNNIGQDPELFTAQGDFQFEVYRLMKSEVDDIWDQFVPKTNILWLFYLVDKLIHEAQYSRYSKRKYEPYYEQLLELYEVTRDYESSYQLTRQLCMS